MAQMAAVVTCTACVAIVVQLGRPGTEQPEGLDSVGLQPLLRWGEPSPPEGGPEIDLGGAADDGQPTDQPATRNPRNYLDVDEVRGPLRPRQSRRRRTSRFLSGSVAGVQPDSRLHPQDAGAGAQRQQAEYALAVQRALQAQPDETLRLLAEQYGVQLSPSQSPPPQQGGSSRPTTMATTTCMRPGGTADQSAAADDRTVDASAKQQREAEAAAADCDRWAPDGSTSWMSHVREVVGTALQARHGTRVVRDDLQEHRLRP